MTLDLDYCAPATAKLLKEVGYNYETEKIWYDPYQYPKSDVPHFKAKLLWKDALNPDQRHWPKYQFPAPLQQVVVKWLRELHDLHIIINASHDEGTVHYEFVIQDLQSLLFLIQGGNYGMYENAVEVATQRCLEIVKDKQNKSK